MGKRKRRASTEVPVPIPSDSPRPLTVQERRARERKRSEDVLDFHRAKLQAGPDATEAAFAVSPRPESAYMAMHHGVGTGKVDGDGTPAMRSEWVRYLDGTLRDTEEGAARHERLEALRTSPKRSHRRAYMLLIAYYGGMTQAEIAAVAGAGGKRITQGRVSQILKAAMDLVRASEPL